MSQKREKHRRYNARLTHLRRILTTFDRWQQSEPPLWKVRAWREWYNARPVLPPDWRN